MPTERQRVKRLAKDLALRLLVSFGTSIIYGLVMLKVFHQGTPASMGDTCGAIAAAVALGTLIFWPPAYLTDFMKDWRSPDGE